MMRPAQLVLAAGESRRLGQPKQLLDWEGKCLVERVVGQMVALEGPTVVVTGAHRKAVEACLDGYPVHCTWNAAYAAGMGTSLAHGARYLIEHFPDTTHLLITLTDLVRLDLSHYQQLLSFASEAPGAISAAHYQDRPGVPIVFPQVFFDLLADLTGDQGARLIVRQHSYLLRPFPLPEAAFDIDTPEDLARWQSRPS